MDGAVLADRPLKLHGTVYQVGETTRPGWVAYDDAAERFLSGGDDDQQTANLHVSLPYPGGSTGSLVACSNGCVSAAGTGTSYVPPITADQSEPTLPRSAARSSPSSRPQSTQPEHLRGATP